MRGKKEKKKPNVFLSVVISSLLGISIGVVILLLISAVSVYINFGSWEIKPSSFAAIIISGLVSGVFCGKFIRKNGLLVGGYCGLFISAICFAVNMFIIKNDFDFNSFSKIICIILASMAGGTIGVNSKEKYF